MPSKNFTNFDLKTSISDTDYIVGYKEDGTAEYRTTFGDLVNYLKPYLEELPPFIKSIDYLVVGGGGAGGATIGAGGGAGGLISVIGEPIRAGVYPVIIGAGGTSTSGGTFNGQNSSFNSKIAFGGGAGGGGYVSGQAGGSGGGSGSDSSYGAGTLGQGYRGGNAANFGHVYDRQGGGGGAGEQGTDLIDQFSYSRGGNGVNWLNLGTYYAGGGGPGASWMGSTTGQPGGLGGGGTGGSQYQSGNIGTPNTGGGGGGAGWTNSTTTYGGKGGSGIVIIRYQGSQIATGGNITFSNGYTYHTFLSSSQFVI
jgi:hypothetical protein